MRCAPEVLLKMPSLVSVPRLLMCPPDVLLIVPLLSSVLVRALEIVPPPELLIVPELVNWPPRSAELLMLSVPLLLIVPELVTDLLAKQGLEQPASKSIVPLLFNVPVLEKS